MKGERCEEQPCVKAQYSCQQHSEGRVRTYRPSRQSRRIAMEDVGELSCGRRV